MPLELSLPVVVAAGPSNAARSALFTRRRDHATAFVASLTAFAAATVASGEGQIRAKWLCSSTRYLWNASVGTNKEKLMRNRNSSSRVFISKHGTCAK